MIDLHSHSTASDGSLAPSELVALAAKTGLKALALTDHDTVAGVVEARAAAAQAGIVFIGGVEIEIDFDPGEFHLLGLGIDEADAGLLAAMAGLAEARRRRNATIVDLLRHEGFDIDLEEITRLAGTENLGRPHIAEALVRRKVVRTKQEAFDRFLGKGRPFYMPKDCLALTEALELIASAGGVAVAAHPYSLFVGKPKLGAVMDLWREMGVLGIEAYHPAAKLGQCRILEAMGRERGFFVTAGSDYHGPDKPAWGLGRTSGGIPIADSYFAELSGVLPSLPSLI
jgi:3',5'-nucleoside bisphosphate phosphatase